MISHAFRFVLLASALFAASCASAPPLSPTVELRLLAINDFHGHLDPPASGIRALDQTGASVTIRGGGGAARRAALVEQRRPLSPNAIMVAAGDLIGASPMLSAVFHDEPTIEALSMMGLAISAVGNHEFDEGPQEVQRMQDGGCHPTDGCRGPTQFQGAQFRYLAASTIVDATGQTLFPASAVREFDGVRVGFIGLTLEGTPEVISPAAAAGLTFRDEVETINAETERLRAQGIEAIVVLIHEGGFRTSGAGDCPGVSGPIVDIVEALHPSVDVVVSGHTNGIYICRIGDKLLTSAGGYSALLTDIVLTLDRASGDIVASEAQNLVVADTLTPNAQQVAHIEAYRTLAAPLMNRPVGALAAPISNARAPSGESPMGLVIADAMVAAAERELGARPDVAFMNPGGVRAELPNAGDVTLSDLFTVQPFGNDVAAFEMTGAEIEALLAQQFRADSNMILHVAGLSYTWRNTVTDTVLANTIRIGGAPLDPARSYRVVTNSFLAAGGDGFTAFRNNRPRTIVGNDLDALEAYVAAHSPLPAPTGGRVRVVTP